MAEALLGSTRPDCLAVSVAQRDSHLAASRGLLAQQVVQGGILLVQEVGRIDEYPDLLLSPAEQIPPQGDWDR
jgi:hypothetical protein